MLTRERETIVAEGAIIEEIPCMDRIDIDRVRDDAIRLVDGADEEF